MTKDPIKPSHYVGAHGLMTWEVIDNFTEHLNGIEAVDTALALRYICRWKKKDGLKDLRKARECLDHLISHLEADHEQTTNKFTNSKAYFENQQDAVQFVADLYYFYTAYGSVRYIDYLTLLGIDIKEPYHEIGWSNLADIRIKNLDDKWTVIMPKMDIFDEKEINDED